MRKLKMELHRVLVSELLAAAPTMEWLCLWFCFGLCFGFELRLWTRLASVTLKLSNCIGCMTYMRALETAGAASLIAAYESKASSSYYPNASSHSNSPVK